MVAAAKTSSTAGLLILFAASAAFCPWVMAARIVEWRIEQKQYLSGDHVIYMTANAIKIINKTIGYELVSRAPDWRVRAFRADDRVMCDVARSDFYKDQEFHPVTDGTANAKLTKIGTQSIGARKVDVFRHGQDELWIGDLPGIGRPIADLILAYYRLRSIDGFLMKISTNGEKLQEKGDSFLSTEYNGRLVMLETLRIKEVPYNPADFVFPTGFKKVENIEKIMTSADRRKEAESIMEELGLGEKLGKQKGK